MAITQGRIFDLLHEIEDLKEQVKKIKEELQKLYSIDNDTYTAYLLSLCGALDTPAYHTEKAHFKAVAKINNRQTLLKRAKRGTLETKALVALPTLESPKTKYDLIPHGFTGRAETLPKAQTKVTPTAIELPYSEMEKIRNTNIALIKTHNPTWGEEAAISLAIDLARQGKTYEHPQDITGDQIEGRFFQ